MSRDPEILHNEVMDVLRAILEQLRRLNDEPMPAPAGEPQKVCQYCDNLEWGPRYEGAKGWWHQRNDDTITMPCEVGWGESQPQAPKKDLIEDSLFDCSVAAPSTEGEEERK